MKEPVGASRPPIGRRWRSLLYEVADESMHPHLSPGDRILVDPGEYRRRPPEVGELVVFWDPGNDRVRLVKVVARPPAGLEEGSPAPSPLRAVYVLGSNQLRSRDSREFGLIPLHRLIGHAWYRLYPPERRGPLGAISIEFDPKL